jgi:hypothetical protein
MSSSAEQPLDTTAVADAAQLPEGAYTPVMLRDAIFRPGLGADLRHLYRALVPGGLLIIQAYLVPAHKRAPLYVQALLSVLQGRRVFLHNQYVWARWLRELDCHVLKNEQRDLSMELDTLALPPLRRQHVQILLAQCPADAVPFVFPPAPSSARQVFCLRQLELIVKRPV